MSIIVSYFHPETPRDVRDGAIYLDRPVYLSESMDIDGVNMCPSWGYSPAAATKFESKDAANSILLSLGLSEEIDGKRLSFIED